ncbi:MAG: 2-succinyl-5-enolpyruvyl-6-hydroxy-3-cyclohexene-1-carboxylic-acid synthase [Planctomycetota bacterium]
MNAAQLQASPNVNAVWSALLVEELVRQGVRRFVIAPGSRSAPLVTAVVRHPQARSLLCRDERAAAFVALGIARGSGAPAAVITTSGSAVANLAPAVVEASTDRMPLLLLTADRPPELRDCGANQTIPQLDLFGGHLRWQQDLPCPDDRVPARMVLTAAAHLVARAVGQAGPTQLNCPFREPLAPTPQAWDAACLGGLEVWLNGAAPFTRWEQATPAPTEAALASLADIVHQAERGILVAGALETDADATAVRALVEASGWPIIADVRSGLRLGFDDARHAPHLARVLAAAPSAPDAVIQFGGQLTSKALQQLLARVAPQPHALVTASPRRVDPDHSITLRVETAAAAAAKALAPRLRPHRGDCTSWLRADRAIEAAIEAAIERDGACSEPFVARWLSRQLPARHGLFLSSSMPIRDMQDFAHRDGAPLAAAANRGASGIDGVVATAAGFAVGRRGPVTLLIGDQALLHDLGSLALLGDLEQPVLVVVINNRGGGIFTALPIAEHRDVFSPWFDGRHDFSFAGVAADLGLTYQHVTSRDVLGSACGAAWATAAPALIEVQCSLADSRAHRQQLNRAIDAAQGS